MDRPASTSSTLTIVLGSAVFVLGLLMDAGMLLISPMMFDAPGSEDSIYPWIIIGSLLCYPVTVLIGLPLAWIAHSRGHGGAALRALAIPLAGAALVVASFVLLQVVCAGNFACR